MAFPEKKKGLALVIGVGKPKGDDEPDDDYSKDEDGDGDVDEAYHSAAEEMASALGVKPDALDVPKFLDAFKLLHKLCSEHSDEPDGDE